MAYEALATLSSFVTGRRGNKAVDGDYNQNIGRCTKTNPQVDAGRWPFLKLYLWKQYGIVSVRIWNRGDCCGTFPPFYFGLM